MSYYHLPTDTERHPRATEPKLSDGRQIGPADGTWTPELAAACGFAVVVETAAPAVTVSEVPVSALTIIDGTPTRTWTVRAKTAAELAADTQATNGATVEAKVRAAITSNATYLAIAAPNAAQNTAQIKALTRQINALIRRQYTDLLADATGI